MANIFAIRKTEPNEPGQLVVDADLFRPEAKEAVQARWILAETGKVDHYRVVGGCPVGLDLHFLDDIVMMSPIASSTTHTHCLIGTDKEV